MGVLVGPNQETRQEESRVELTGRLAEFRDALDAEIEAARRNSAASAVQLVHGERIARAADRYQYLFKLEQQQLALVDDLPGDLYVGGERYDATVISLAGLALTLSVAVDLGEHIPRARLSSNLSNLLRSLISRIEEYAATERANPAGGRLLGDQPAGGSPVAGLELPDLNPEQAMAVASGLGCDTTFIQGPPGTGKTKTIGTLGHVLAADQRSVLLVSHTNSAVDQALHHIASAMPAEALAEGKILRLGQPKDERIIAWRDLLVETHVARRSEALVAERDALESERAGLVVRIDELARLLGIFEWVRNGLPQLRDTGRQVGQLREMQRETEDTARRLADEEQRTAGLQPLHAEACAVAEQAEAIPGLRHAADTAARDAEAAATGREERCAAARSGVAADLEAEERGLQVPVSEAQAMLADAEALHQRHRQQLDQARQIRLMSDRFAQLPSVDFAAARVDEREAAVIRLDGETASAEQAFDEANDLLAQARDAGRLARLARRLPDPAHQQTVVDTLAGDLADSNVRMRAEQTELEAARTQLAETQRLRAELDEWRDFPLVEDIEPLLTEDEQAVASAQAALVAAQRTAATAAAAARAAAERRYAERVAAIDAEIDAAAGHARAAAEARDATIAAVESFTARHGRLAAQLRDELARELEQLETLRTRHAELQSAVRTLRAASFEALDRQRRLLRALRLDAPDTDDIEPLFAGLQQAAEDAQREVAATTEPEIEAEQRAVRDRVVEIDRRVTEIADALTVVEAQVIADATVLATTLTKAYLRDEIQARSFDTVILDEASMAGIPALWVAAGVAEHSVVIVGDPMQLPPIAQAEEGDKTPQAVEDWLVRDIFAAAGVTANDPRLVKLLTQYRMHPAISAAPNALVYGGELRDGPNTIDDSGLDDWYRRDWGHDHPLLLVDTEKTDAWCTTIPSGGSSSRLNFLSATIATGLAAALLREDRTEAAGGEARILIATPYRPQARLLTLLLRDAGIEGEVIAGTVHSFQGSEAPVVIYDLVLDEPHWRAGLFWDQLDESNKRQFNVGLTRAKHRLIVLGDFKWLRGNGKRAFLGRLLERMDGAPVVDAHDVVPVGLSARAARAQSIATGDENLGDGGRLVVTGRDFDEYFLADVAAAQRQIVIYSPFITANRLGIVETRIRAAIERGVGVYVVTKPHAERGKRELDGYRYAVGALQRWGVTVAFKKATHEKLVFVDDDIVWVGSLNPLSFRDTREIMERRRSRSVANDFRAPLRYDEVFDAYRDGAPTCPVCGEPMAVGEGRRGLFRTCSNKCFSADLGDPPLRDGKIACHCGGAFTYGTWGQDHAWRCTENNKHRQKIYAQHLRLPEMLALVPEIDLKKLLRDLGVDGPRQAG